MSDEIFTLENWKALFSFYDKFPELKNLEVYLTGEAYAGITIPKSEAQQDTRLQGQFDESMMSAPASQIELPSDFGEEEPSGE